MEASLTKLAFRSIDLLEATDTAAAAVFVDGYAGPPWYEKWSIEMAKERISELANTPNCLSIGAFVGDRLAGFAAGIPQTGVKGPAMYLAEIVVERSQQNSGIGSLLLSNFERAASKDGYQSTWLVAHSAEASSRF